MGKFNTDDIKTRNDLRATIEKLTGVTFKKVGGWWFTKCPIHGEDTPSFHIKDSEPDFFKCEGCRASGDVIKFVQTLKQMDFKEACEFLGGDAELNPIEAKRLEEERKAETEARITKEQQQLLEARSRFNATRVWEKYNAAMKPEDVAWWEGRGVEADWQTYWKVGAVDSLWSCYGKAFSIPYLTPAGVAVTCQYRFKTPNGLGPYRFEPDLGKSAFIARPDLSFRKILIVEGAIKAMVVAQVLSETDWQVIGFPDKYNAGGIYDQLKQSKLAYVWLDPDAWQKQQNDTTPFVPWPVRHAKEIGPHARVVQFPEKVDDWILWSKCDKDAIFDILRMARKA